MNETSRDGSYWRQIGHDEPTLQYDHEATSVNDVLARVIDARFCA